MNRDFYADLRAEYTWRGKRCVARAEWREDEGKWVSESKDFDIRLWPDESVEGDVNHTARLFNPVSKGGMEAARDALIEEARSHVYV